MIPEFAILGHPNEGKSSVLSTLSEDDSVRISSTPGETVWCRSFPVMIDNQEIISFTDTPGFQNPGRMLSELQKFAGSSTNLLENFFLKFQEDKDFHHDCELLKPILRGAGIIYVADGARPIRNVDRAEMEILRLSGKPRMAILNCKGDELRYLDEWKTEFRRHFNSSRVFNAHRATYSERIRLLEALKSIEQDWQEVLDYVVTTFKDDWQNRNIGTAEIICELLQDSLRLELQTSVAQEAETAPAKEQLFQRYKKKLRELERHHHGRIKKLFKHNIFDYHLGPQSILNQDLFADQTWEFLGLKKSRLAMAGGAGGAALAAGLDIAAGGASLGLFTTIGGALGALGAVFGSKNVAASIQVLGIDTAKIRLQIGPNTNPQFPFILLDRALLYYGHVINWAHGRRDYEVTPETGASARLSGDLGPSSQRDIAAYCKALQNDSTSRATQEKVFKKTVLNLLNSISNAQENEERSFH